MKRLLVIGGGLAGLSAAWHARRAGAAVRLLESAANLGGVIQSYQENGFLAESGPNTLTVSTPATAELLRALGLEAEILEPDSAARRRYIARGGNLVSVPMSAWGFITTPLFSARAKLRLLREPFIAPRPAAADAESVADFARRRLGPEALAYAVEPMVGGIFAGNPEKLAVRHAFPRLCAWESAHGALARAAFALARARRRGGAGSFRPRAVSFRAGLAALPRALAAQLDAGSIVTRARLTRLERQPEGTWAAAWTTAPGAGGETSADGGGAFDAVVLAVPAPALVGLPLPPALTATLGPLADIEYPPVSVVILGYPRAAVWHPLDGFGALVPAVEPYAILGTLFTSSLFAGRAPAGHVVLTSFVGGARRPELAARPDSELVALVTRDLEKLLGASGAPVYQRVCRWPRAIPQYDAHHAAVLEALAAAERAWPGLALAGSYRGGVSVAQTLASGRAAAAQALGESSEPSPSDFGR